MKLLKPALLAAAIIALIIFITANKPPMENDFAENWKKVDSLANIGQPRSALEIVDDVYRMAKDGQNTPQIIKANLYRIKLMADFEEDHLYKVIENTKKEIETATFPGQEILHSILGDLYMRYFQVNRYQIMDRGRIQGVPGEDFRTWDAHTLLSTAAAHYKASIKPAEQLQEIDLNAFSAILEEKKDSKLFRPTLFDFLAYRAIDFFASGESGITVAADQFKPDNPDYFASAGRFINLTRPENRESTFTAQIIIIYQQLLKFHLGDKNPQALIDADLKRLEFIRANAVIDNADGLYFNALTSLKQKYNTSEHSADVSFELAKYHEMQAGKYNPQTGDDFRWERKKAVEICEEAIKKFPTSAGAENCRILVDELVKPGLSLQTEFANLPGKPSVGLLNWRNYSKIYFRLIRMDYREYQKIAWRVPAADLATRLLKIQPEQTWQLVVPNELDFQNHSTEFKIPALSNGFYILMASGSESFNGKDAEVAWADFWETKLTFIAQRMENGGHEFYVLDRGKGTPLRDVTVRAFTRDYDFKTREYIDNLMKTYTTDRNGYFRIEPVNTQGNATVTLEFIQKDDVFFPASNFYVGPQRGIEARPELRTFFFTDRAIYRPGQTVYFKAIVLERTGDKQEIKAGHPTRIEFFDVNYQMISALDLKTNEYGAVNGSFTIPTGMLNGQMTIRNSSGSAVFSVEDYKRPTFEVTFEPVTGSFKLNTEVTVDGTVKGYAGNVIDGANVKYRVVRRSTFPYRWMYYRGFFPDSPEMELLSGETITDGNGKFNISFNAIPDQSLSRDHKPVFQYTVYASVTDVSGETQAGEHSVSVGYDALFLNVDIPEKLDRSVKQKFNLESVNLNGVKQETTVKAEISLLKDPGKLYIDRLWGKPDFFLMDQETFSLDFPDRIYSDETNPEKWEKVEIVFSKTLNTKTDSLLNPENLSTWKAGKYSIKLTATDVFGNPVETLKFFTVFSPADKQPPLIEYSWFTPLKSSGEPGEEAAFLIGTAARSIKALYEVQHRGKTISREWLTLDREQKHIKVPIKEEYRGNFSVQITYVIAGREFKNSMIITVPYTNKQLDLAFETFRSQLEPGSREEWKVTIRNKKGEQVVAQMLASMYDASLDAFVPHGWSFDIYHQYGQITPWQSFGCISVSRGNRWDFALRQYKSYNINEYDRLNWFGFNEMGFDMFYSLGEGGPKSRMAVANEMDVSMDSGVELKMEEMESSSGVVTPPPAEPPKAKTVFDEMQVRRDFNETAFFYPELQTNEQGEVVISFTLPESFTRWRFMGLGYTRDLMTGMLEQEFTASKKLMVMPNAPRFFRMGDTLQFSSRITNLSDEALNGTTTIEFFDAVSMQPINEQLQIVNDNHNFTIEANRSTSVKWRIIIPEDYGVITYRIKATAGNYTDGEEKSIPVLPNRMLVTESLPMPINGIGTKTFRFEKLVDSDKSTSLKHQNLTIEFTSNPAWYAIQALPVIAEPIHKNTLSVFAAFYANSIAFFMANANPKIKRVFDSWKNQTPETFLSNLEKNQDLKALLLEQTPWILQARSEAERKQRVALLFDLNNMNNRLDATIRMLSQMQSPNGGFPWFEGMPDSRYITQNVVEGLGKLHQMRIIDALGDERVNRMMSKAVRYLDDRIREDYEEILKYNKDKMDEDHLSATHIQFLYARSFFSFIMMNPNSETAFNYFKTQAGKYWQKQNIYLQGMLAIALTRYENRDVPPLIIKSLRERSLKNEEMGMYWKLDRGYFWYQSPVETQAMMIEAFDEVAGDKNAVDQMKIWLLKQKQTQDWKTSRATVEAVYALIRRGSDLLASDKLVEIEMAGKKLDTKDVGQIEAGTGYFQTSWSKGEITPQMGNISVTKTDEGIAWGAVYWQYFENLDKITAHETPLSLKKELFVERNKPEGTILEPLNDGDKLRIGEKVVVRIELRIDRDMEFVHMQDMRASAFEPVNVLSGYKYKGGLGYYQSTRDAATNFFFDYLRKGVYVFEYPLVASQTGNFSNGISTIQCMYAPEFSSHSQGIRVVVE
ncbi:MAG: hypothetical protein IH598_06020 [Bacteroidales bacterium]|nr:hypothetical protein [Bacteroidales bacterium]